MSVSNDWASEGRHAHDNSARRDATRRSMENLLSEELQIQERRG